MTSEETAEITENPIEEPSTTDKEEVKIEVTEEEEKPKEAVKEVTEELLIKGEDDDKTPVQAEDDKTPVIAEDEDEAPKEDDGSAKDHGEGDEDVTMTFPQRVSSCCELLSSLFITEGRETIRNVAC
jgi:hypothetical protein